MASDIARSGWAHRQSSILKRWKRMWLALQQNGELRYFERPEDARAEDAIHMPSDTLGIHSGAQCRHVDPPHKLPVDCLFSVIPRHGSVWQFCAETPDDCIAWKMALDQARSVMQPNLRRTSSLSRLHGLPPPGYYAYIPDQVINGQYPATGYVYQSAPGQITQVYVVDRPGYYYGGRDYSLGMGMAGGFATGALLGTAMMGPLWWC